jgi:four helix bundle protein
MNERKNLIKDRSFQFAIRVTSLYRTLIEARKEYVLSKQLLRSGTSVGANVREAQNAESQADFIHKLAIAQKECDETIYWLELLEATNFISKTEFDTISSEASILLKMIKSAILTTKQKSKNITHNS